MYSKKVTNYREPVLLYFLEMDWCEGGVLSFDRVRNMENYSARKNRRLI